MKSQIYGAAALLIAALTLGGCAAALKGFPDRVADTETELTALKPFMNADAIKAYKDATGDAKKLKRDEYVNARISAIDLHFGEFEKALFQEGVGGGIATDWLKLALGGAGTLYAGASQALSAAVTGIEGAKASFDKQAFFANTITTLFAAMDANRKTIQVKIRQGLGQPVADYPLTQAFADLESYYLAGTIPGALISINADSGAKGAKADKVLKATYGVDDNTTVLLEWLEFDPEAAVGKRYGNSENHKNLKAWLKDPDKGNLKGVPVTFFLKGAKYAEARSKAVSELIPTP